MYSPSALTTSQTATVAKKAIPTGTNHDIADGDYSEESKTCTDMHKSLILNFFTYKSTTFIPPRDFESRVGSLPYKYVNETQAAALKNETSPLINDQHNFSSIADVKALNLDAVPDKHALKSKEEADVAEPAKSCGYDGAEPGGTRIAAASGRSKTLTCLEVDVVSTDSFDKASKSYVNNCSKRSKYWLFVALKLVYCF